MTTTTPASSSPAIYRLNIERFRGVRSLSWCPGRKVNVILGGGDVGKTTILDAIGLLLHPTNNTSVTDTDYYARDDAGGFTIEAVMSLPAGGPVDFQTKPSWPWVWNGSDAVVPSVDEDNPVVGEAVYRLRVRGTEDLEVFHEIVQPHGETDTLSVSLRRAIGLVRLSGDDRNDRDIRLVQGSALDRLLSDKGLRARLTNELAKSDVKKELSANAVAALLALDTAFKDRRLPSGLDLAITGSQGVAITALIGLTATQASVQLPLASWGAGTRRLSALAIAEQNQGETPVTLVDEVERGLEPYRQRVLLQKLQAGKSQAFITTHSPAVIAAASEASIWYVDHAGKVGPLESSKVARHRVTDPEAFLSRLTIVAEGATEVGFVGALLERALSGTLIQHGIHVTDAVGHETMLELLEALSAGGVLFGGFGDDESGQHATRWGVVSKKLGPLLFRWNAGCVEENVINVVPEDKLEALVQDPNDEKTGRRLRNLADRLGSAEKDFGTLKSKAGAKLRQIIIEAATGRAPDGTTDSSKKKEYKSLAKDWFKTESGGRELLAKLFELGPWSALKPTLLPFCNAVRAAVELPGLVDVPP